MRRNRSSHCLFGMLVLIIMLATGLTARAQTFPEPVPTPSVSSTRSLEKDFFKNILQDQKAIWTAPFHIQRHDAKWIVPGSIGLMAFITTDRITGDKIAEHDGQMKTSRIVSYGGSLYSLGAVAGTFYLIGRNKNNDRARETGLLSAEALIDSVIVESALKGVSQRARPQDGPERSEFFEGGSSFPSGHSTQAWAVATVIAKEYQHNRAVQIGAYGIATAVSVARFTGEKHYISDVLAGSALGWAIGNYVYHARHRKPLDIANGDGPVSETRWPTITPEFNRRAHAYGIGIKWSF